MTAPNGEEKESLVIAQNNQGVELHGSLLRFTRYLAVFELYNPAVVLRMSEVLDSFKLVFNERTIYAGKATVSNLVNAGLMTVCEVALDENAWRDVVFSPEMVADGRLHAEFVGFMEGWQKLYRVLPDFKVVMADMQSFLADLRLWLEQVELEIRSSPSADRIQLERDVVYKLAAPVVKSIDAFIERFEAIAGRLEPDLQPVHRGYLRRQLHPLVLSSPFAYRAFHKPLGFAGDYEVVDMMLRPPHEGSTLFAKILNVWLLGQAPAQAHRNRVAYLERRLHDETSRVLKQGRVPRVFNLACGPAAEVLRFLRGEGPAENAQLTLLDFNDETLQHLRRALEEVTRGRTCRSSVQLVKKSVHQMLKESAKSVGLPRQEQYDFVYCAGLFDYLSDQVCRRLMSLCYDLLAPGGLLLATNVSDAVNSLHPFRYSMEYILDWHLIYRDRAALAGLAPERAPADGVSLLSEVSGVDLFVEVRKPDHD
jgi:extracellular factor (EF) 3-hydroxypalmitic acid methyl ester biosynthesis protein